LKLFQCFISCVTTVFQSFFSTAKRDLRLFQYYFSDNEHVENIRELQ